MKKILNMITIGLLIFGFVQMSGAQRMREELREKRTYNSKTYLNSDDTYTTEISLGSMHYRNEKGELEEISRNFVLSGSNDYAYEITKGFYHVYFKSDISQPNSMVFETQGGAGIVCSLVGMGYMDQSKKDFYTIQSSRPTSAVATGNTIAYSNVFRDVSVKYTYKDTQLKEEIYLTQAARNALPNPSTYGMKSDKTWLVFITELNTGAETIAPYVGSNKINKEFYEGEDPIQFKNLKGTDLFSIGMDYAFLESVKDSLSQQNRNIQKLKRRIITQDGKTLLLSGVPLQWLASQPSGTIVFDPQMNIQPPAAEGQDNFVYYLESDENSKNINYGSSNLIMVGTATSSSYRKHHRTLIKFDLDMIPDYAIINNATLYAYLAVGNTHGTGALGSYIQRVTSQWGEMTSTWNTQPSSTPTNQVNVPAPGVNSDVTVTVTVLVQDMITYGNYGLIWRIQSEVPYNRLIFASSDNTEASDWPKLIVDYTLGAVSTTYYIRDAAGNVIATYKK